VATASVDASPSRLSSPMGGTGTESFERAWESLTQSSVNDRSSRVASRQLQHVGPQHAFALLGFTARTKALMNFPST